jgi:D-lactate dehydrogenase (cytochrome)
MTAASCEIRCETLPAVDLAAVRCIEGKDVIAAQYAPYLSDESKMAGQGADYLFFPASEAEVGAVMTAMAAQGVKVTISGARTGIAGGAVPFGGALLSLDRLDKPLGIRFDQPTKEWRVVCQPSVTLTDLGDWIKKKAFPGLKERGSKESLAALEAFRNDAKTYFYPPDPTEMSAFLGGTVATNASGSISYKYGATREWIRRLRIVLASGEVLDIPRGRYAASAEGTFVIARDNGSRTTVRLPSYAPPRARKNTAGLFNAPGMDLIDLFIGCEGTLGAITEVEVALAEWHGTVSVIQFLPNDDAALDFVLALREGLSADDRLRPEFVEFYDGHALDLLRAKQRANPKSLELPQIPDDAGAAIFFDVKFDPAAGPDGLDYSLLERAVKRCGSTFANSWASYERRDYARFKHFRHALPETVNATIGLRKKQYPSLHKLGTDLAVSDEHLKEIWHLYRDTLEPTGLEWVGFGHIGDNHFHVNIMPRNPEELAKGLAIYQEFAKTTVAMGGTVSAEHGIGKMKKKFLSVMFSAAELEEMKAVKRAFDPTDMINPGNVLDM